jgi:hypothetical protein
MTSYPEGVNEEDILQLSSRGKYNSYWEFIGTNVVTNPVTNCPTYQKPKQENKDKFEYMNH